MFVLFIKKWVIKHPAMQSRSFGSITCKVLEEPITSLLLADLWNDIMASCCLSGGLIRSSDGAQDRRSIMVFRKMIITVIYKMR